MHKYKLVMLGEQSVGKTSIITRFMYDTFDYNYQPTIAVDFLSKTVYLEDRTVRFQLWDTAGQERFRSLTSSYIRDCSVAVVVYDVCNRQSFTAVRKWVTDVKADRGASVTIVVLGNKCDLGDKRQVSVEEGEELAKELGVKLCEVSAKSGDNVKSTFKSIAESLPIPVKADANPAQANAGGAASGSGAVTIGASQAGAASVSDAQAAAGRPSGSCAC